MKPILLKISAFGSYATEEIIDFTGIQKGIFLITGDTGSGKTTIFDAMTFALFDQTSTGKRDACDMRSQYASADVPTYVEFTFSIKGETYRIRRNPRYFRPSKRRDKDGNSKLTVEAPMVELYLPDDVLFLGKLKETNEEIIRIIGLDVNQFTQTCMLAQGEFLKLLHASSHARSEIFARLFHTGVYEQIEEKLREKAKDMNQLLLENETLSIHELANITPMQEGAYKEAWSQLRESWNHHKTGGFLPMSDILSLLEQIVREIEGGYRKAEREVACLEETVQIEKTLLEREANYRENKANLQEIEQFLAQNEEVLKKLAKKREATQEKVAKEQEPLMQEILRLQDAMPKYKKQQEIRIQVRAFQEKCRELEEMITQRGIPFLAADTTEELIRQETDIGRELENFHKKQEELQRFEQLFKAYEKAEKERIKEQQKVLEQLEAYEKCTKAYEEMYATFIREQVGIIAAGLEENKPCPVCGSLLHPAPAKIVQKDVTEQKVKEARAEKSRAEALLHSGQQSLQAAQLEENTYLTQVTQEGEALFPDFRIGKGMQQCQEVRQIWKEQQEGLEECKQLVAYAQKMTLLLEENRTLAEQLPKEDYAAAGKKLEETREKLRLLRDAASQADADYRKLHQLVMQKKGALETAAELLNRVKKEKEELEQQFAFQKMQNQLAGIIPEQNEEYGDIYHRARSRQQELFLMQEKNNAAFGKIKQLFADRKEWIQQYEMVSKLSKTANGNVSGAVKMDFQTFMQRYYFKKIIAEANKRLLKMSNQQFLLKCKEIEDIGTQGAAGLDLSVYSLVTDSTRDVKTLSGGESFMAALAMALGMSDVIRNSVGGIHMETMFVDEGFGSLDEEARNQAIGILLELAGSSRLIGIISHVSELKEQIANKLIVRKNNQGSTVQWLTE